MLKFTSIHSYVMHKRNSHWINAIKEDYELVTGITNRAIETKNSKEKKSLH